MIIADLRDDPSRPLGLDRHELAYARCRVFRCALCWRVISWDDGCDGDSLCSACFVAAPKEYQEGIFDERQRWDWRFESIVTPKAAVAVEPT